MYSKKTKNPKYIYIVSYKIIKLNICLCIYKICYVDDEKYFAYNCLPDNNSPIE